METCCLALREGIPGRDWKKWLTKKRFFFVCIFCCVPSKKSFFCQQLLRYAQPWFDPPDRTIVRSGGSNHGQEGTTGLRFSKAKLTCPLKSTDRKGLWDRLENWCPFLFILFHRFFFLKKKRAEKGRKRQGRDTRLENFFKKVNKRNIYIKKGRNTRITLRFSLLWYIFIILSFYIFLFIMADIA